MKSIQSPSVQRQFIVTLSSIIFAPLLCSILFWLVISQFDNRGGTPWDIIQFILGAAIALLVISTIATLVLFFMQKVQGRISAFGLLLAILVSELIIPAGLFLTARNSEDFSLGLAYGAPFFVPLPLAIIASCALVLKFGMKLNK